MPLFSASAAFSYFMGCCPLRDAPELAGNGIETSRPLLFRSYQSTVRLSLLFRKPRSKPTSVWSVVSHFILGLARLAMVVPGTKASLGPKEYTKLPLGLPLKVSVEVIPVVGIVLLPVRPQPMRSLPSLMVGRFFRNCSSMNLHANPIPGK